MATLTIYPDADPESTSCDGRVQRRDISGDPTWSEIRDGAGTSGDADSVSDMVNISADPWDDGYWSVITRGVVLFDTSAIPNGAVITAATLSLYGDSKVDDLVILPDINIYSASPASNTDLIAADYGTLGTTAYCDTPITYANWSITGYNDFILNATGLAAISQIGITKFGVRNANYDAADVEPSNAPAAQSSNLYWHTADNVTGDSRKPKLVITYGPTISGFIWVEDTDVPTDRVHFTDSAYIERANLAVADVDDTPVDGATTAPISSNWAYDYAQVWEDKKKLAYLGL